MALGRDRWLLICALLAALGMPVARVVHELGHHGGDLAASDADACGPVWDRDRSADDPADPGDGACRTCLAFACAVADVPGTAAGVATVVPPVPAKDRARAPIGPQAGQQPRAHRARDPPAI